MIDPAGYPWLPLKSVVTTDQFRAGLQLLQRYFTFIRLSDAVDILNGNRPSIDNALVLTFDDGYLNNFQDALPILKELNIPATFYLVGAAMKEQIPFWYDRLDYALQMNVQSPQSVRFLGEEVYIDDVSKGGLVRTMNDLFEIAHAADEDDFELSRRLECDLKRIESIGGRSLLDPDVDARLMAIADPDTIRTALESCDLIELGSHTLHHVRLDQANAERAMAELRQSALLIGEEFGVDCVHFCYPNGSWNMEARRHVEAAGYASAVTCDEGMNFRDSVDLYALRRINWASNAGPKELLALASGIYPQ